MAFETIDWNKLERFLLYISSATYAVWKIVTIIMPTANTPRAQAGQVGLLAGVIFATLVYLIKQLERLGLNTYRPQMFSSFSTALRAWLKDIDRVDDMLICAYTSHTFRHHLWADRAHMNNVRLLLFYPTDDFPNIDGFPDPSGDNIQTTIDHWKRMKDDGVIATLEIRQRRYNASFFFAVVNKSKMIQGLLWPRKGMGGLEPQKIFVLGSESAGMREQIAMHVDWFEKMWEVAEKR